MRAALIQCSPGAGRSENIAMIGQMIDDVSDVDLISLPEMWTCLGGDRATKLAESETLPPAGEQQGGGPAFRFLRDTARRLGVTVHGGSIGERDGETLFNTTLVFGADGAELGRYRKIHLFDAVTPSGQGYRESSLFGAGDRVVACSTSTQSGQATLGLSICYDLRFPELYAALRQAGADVILVPSAFTVETGRAHWETLLRARAIETQCWVIAAATTGAHQDAAGRLRATYGHSLVVDPWGEVHADGGDGPGVVRATIDPAVTARIRESMPVLAHRRVA